MNSRNAEHDVSPCDCCTTVLVSHLALDMPAPVAGWEAMLAAHGIELLEDDLGRMAIRREDARALMAERRQWELDHVEEARRREEETARKSRPVLPGIPFPKEGDPSMTAYEVMRGADADAERSDPRRRISPHEGSSCSGSERRGTSSPSMTSDAGGRARGATGASA